MIFKEIQELKKKNSRFITKKSLQVLDAILYSNV